MSIFQSKQKKIVDHLNNKSNAPTVFDLLLKDYLNGKLSETLSEYGISKIKIYVDWHTDYKCIDIQGIYNNYYLNLQIEEDIFRFAFGKDEPDDFSEYPLTDRDLFYDEIKNAIKEMAQS